MAKNYQVRRFCKFSWAALVSIPIGISFEVFLIAFVSKVAFKTAAQRFLLIFLAVSPRSQFTSAAWKFSLAAQSETRASHAPLK